MTLSNTNGLVTSREKGCLIFLQLDIFAEGVHASVKSVHSTVAFLIVIYATSEALKTSTFHLFVDGHAT